MQTFSEGRCNNLRIGIASSYARTLLPQLLPSLVENCPNIKLELFERNFSDLSDLLTHHKVDLIITRPPYPCNTVTVPLIEESISIYAPKAAIKNNFPNRSEEIIKQLSETADLRTLRDCLFILPRSGSVRDSCDKLFLASQISPHILVETDFMETAIAFSRTGMGITLAPTGMLQALEKQPNDDQKVTGIYPIAKKSISRSLALCYPDRAVVSPAMQKFIAIARARLSKRNSNKLF
ncbi:LysR family transcriptional regulator substrate-binding protein [Caproicibacterium sp. NSD3]